MKIRDIGNKGFTLLELLIVIAIIGVLSAVVAPQLVQYLERAKESNDLRAATNIVKAASVSIYDPINDIPTGYFVELVWVTGDESGASVTRGSLIIRNSDNNRVSQFNNGDADDVRKSEFTADQLQRFADSIYMVLDGQTATHLDGHSNWYQIEYADAESKTGNSSNFAIHINTTTGEVALASLKGASNVNETNRWITLGLDVLPAPAI